MEITRLTDATEQMLADINKVTAQLHDDGRMATMKDLQVILGDKNIALVAVKDGEKVVGLTSLYIMPKIGVRNAYIEDVVIDSEYRSKGLGELMVRKVLEIAGDEGVNRIYLTSRPVHAAAHNLYKKVGFSTKETTVFKIDL